MVKLEPEFANEYQQWQKYKSPQTRKALLHKVQPVVDTAIRNYAGNTQGSPATRSQAKLLAMDAIESYDPARATLRTHLLSNLQRLRRYSAQQQQLVSMPERVASARYQVEETRKTLEEELGRPPSLAELADHTGLSIKKLQYVQQGGAPLTTGTLRAHDQQSAPAVKMPGTDPGEDAWLEFVYDDLQPTDQIIMEYLLGMHGKNPASVSEVARKLGLSPGAISQRASRIQKLLDTQDELKVF